MSQLFEYIDTLQSPYEAFRVDSRYINDPPRPHWHYYVEIIYVEDGEVYVECDEKKATLSRGDVAFFHAKRIHTVVPMPPTYRYGVIKFDISRLSTPGSSSPRLRAITEAARRADVSCFFRAGTLSDDLVSRVFSTVIDELREKRYGYDLVVHSDICELMIALARVWREEGLDTSGPSAAVTGGNDIESVTEYIDDHSAEPLRVADLAKMCGMSYSYFAKNFRQMYGRSCKDYIEFVRVSKAEDLLLFTDHDLTRISMETGFADCSHLIKVFRRWKDVTPKQYRLQRHR
ncbi:MAG: helix-turn-helix transcriptional regulator [Lachnospiraceae bacterium]|nr:helix-turn-helix transcriptional regulator [Lachnospiraceae bacterium]